MELKVIGYNLSPDAGIHAITSLAWMCPRDLEHISAQGIPHSHPHATPASLQTASSVVPYSKFPQVS